MNIKKQIIYWVPVYIYMGLIFYFSSQSYVSVSGGVGVGSLEIIPYLQHIVEYLILGMLIFRGFINSIFRKKSFGLSIILSGLYGLGDEIHQHFVPGRFFSFVDIGFDFLGILIGVVVISLVYKLFRTRRK